MGTLYNVFGKLYIFSWKGQFMNGSEKLRQFALTYCRKKIFKISERVIYFANYGPSSATAVIGDTSVILIDTLRSKAYSRQMLQDLRQFTDKPVRTVIFTSSIPELAGGSCEFEGTDLVIEAVKTHEPLKDLDKVQDIKQMRRIWTRGYGLAEKLILPGTESGKGRYEILAEECLHPLEVTQWISEETDMMIDGVHFRLIPAPSETSDSMIVWLPEEKAACAGSIFYGVFPNLDVTTGSSYFNLGEWIRSLKRLRALEPEVLLPGMTIPLQGREEIAAALGTEIDCFEYLLDIALDMINDGLTIEEMLAHFSLPERFEVWYLTPYYGRAEWVLRCLYDRYMGWFDGLAAHLDPVPEAEYNETLMELIGDKALQAKIKDLIREERYQLALQLCELGGYRNLKKEVLELLAEASDNLNERYYFYSRILDL